MSARVMLLNAALLIGMALALHAGIALVELWQPITPRRFAAVALVVASVTATAAFLLWRREQGTRKGRIRKRATR